MLVAKRSNLIWVAMGSNLIDFDFEKRQVKQKEEKKINNEVLWLSFNGFANAP